MLNLQPETLFIALLITIVAWLLLRRPQTLTLKNVFVNGDLNMDQSSRTNAHTIARW